MPPPEHSIAFLASFRNRRTVSRPIAAEVWKFKDAKGRKRDARIAVGQPEPIPGDKEPDWFCPVYVEGWTPHVMPICGIGPVDALMNALTLVRSFREHVADMHIRSDCGRTSRKSKTAVRRA